MHTSIGWHFNGVPSRWNKDQETGNGAIVRWRRPWRLRTRHIVTRSGQLELKGVIDPSKSGDELAGTHAELVTKLNEAKSQIGIGTRVSSGRSECAGTEAMASHGGGARLSRAQQPSQPKPWARC
eukprot:scaffold26324_cov40-Prasinocladus_malaysianus.AAC.2